MSDSIFNVEHVPAGTTNENVVDKTEDTQPVSAGTVEEDDDLDDLDGMEFMLDEIENRIAPLA
ncbi:MAG TPA: ammosamide/lymphostin RiPP family protein [Pseudonocardiaceae bacterium]|jgi:hypothetical protein|nr:ammosamide/lymphostin RiPP family protein [Pseudonocardiaceae bacterium]